MQNTPIESKAQTTAPLLIDAELVHRQLHCVKYLCGVVSELAECKIKMLPRTLIDPSGGLGHHLIKMDGAWTGSFMEWVGELLNNMNANDPEQDKKWDKTFEEARARWKNLESELNTP